MNKKKKFDLFDETMKTGQISTGTMIVGATPGLISHSLPGTTNLSNTITTRTSRPLALLPTIQGTSTVFKSMGLLTDIEKKLKKRR